MTSEHRPVRTTIILGGMGALAWIVADWATGGFGAWPLNPFGLIWLSSAGFAVASVFRDHRSHRFCGN